MVFKISYFSRLLHVILNEKNPRWRSEKFLENFLKEFSKKIRGNIFFHFLKRQTMSFNPELIQVSKSNDKYSNLVHGKDSITFALKECYSHFGLSFNKEFRNYLIALTLKTSFLKD